MTGLEEDNLNNEKDHIISTSDNTSENQSVAKKSIKYPSVLDRYYTQMYCLNIDGVPIEHQCVLFHSNKICLLTIAPSHPIIMNNKTVNKINCILSDNIDRTKNKVSGKGKKGGQKLQPHTVLCVIECSDGSSYKIFSCIKGKLIEMNTNLFVNPNLLNEKPYTEGHIAIVLSDLHTVEECKKNMVIEEEYRKILPN